MKELFKIAACALLVLALAPIAGFWVVALVGVALFLLPVGVIFSAIFPKTCKHIEDDLFAGT
jgi:fatty acid desaturase